MPYRIIYPEDFLNKKRAFEILKKAFDKNLITPLEFNTAHQNLEKAKSNLVKKKVFAKRKDGKVYLTTVYVNPDTKEKVEDPNAKYIEVPIGTPETMVGEHVKVTKKNGDVIEGVVKNIEYKGGKGVVVIHQNNGKITSATNTVISKFEKFDVAGGIEEPKGEVDKNGYTILKKLGGSTGALLVEKNGKKFVKKTAANPEHLSSEMRSLNYMSQIGVPVPKVEEYIKGEAAYMEYIEGKTLKMVLNNPNIDDSVKDIIKGKITDYFVAQCLFANHDCIGLDYDNVLFNTKGDPVFVDVGGAMGFRAMGQPKNDWNNYTKEQPVSEISTMLDANLNKQSSEIFSVIDNENLGDLIKIQLKEIINKNPSWYTNPNHKDKEILKARLDRLLENFGEETKKVEEEDITKKVKSFDEQQRYEALNSLYSREKDIAQKYGRTDIVKFFDELVDHMYLTDEEYNKFNEEHSYYNSKNYSKKYMSDLNLKEGHLMVLKGHTGSANYANTPLKQIVKGKVDGYNISIKDKEKTVSFDKKEFKNIAKDDLMRAKFMLDAFAKARKTQGDLYKRDLTLYRGLGSSKKSQETFGKNGDNIYYDIGVSSNAMQIGKSFGGNTKIVTTMAEGIELALLSGHDEAEVIQKPFNMMQTIKFYDRGDDYSGGRFQVRVEPPGLIEPDFTPIKEQVLEQV